MITIAIIGIISLNQIKTANINNISDIDTISYSDSFTQEENNYLVYFWQEGCQYCEQIEDDVLAFAQDAETPIYIVDMQASENQKAWYDWEAHHAQYDEKIGQVVDGEQQLDSGIDPEDYTSDTEVNWQIGINDADEIIATHNTPYGNTAPASPNEIEITGTPTIMHVTNESVEAYTAGVEETRSLLEETP